MWSRPRHMVMPAVISELRSLWLLLCWGRSWPFLMKAKDRKPLCNVGGSRQFPEATIGTSEDGIRPPSPRVQVPPGGWQAGPMVAWCTHSRGSSHKSMAPQSCQSASAFRSRQAPPGFYTLPTAHAPAPHELYPPLLYAGPNPTDTRHPRPQAELAGGGPHLTGQPGAEPARSAPP